MKFKSMVLSVGMIVFSTSVFAVECRDFPIITPDNGTNIVSQMVSPGVSGMSRSHGYSGIPGQAGCPIKAGPGTCVDAGKSLSDSSGGSPAVFANVDLKNGIVDDIERHRLGFISPISVPWLGIEKGFNPTTGYIPGAC